MASPCPRMTGRAVGHSTTSRCQTRYYRLGALWPEPEKGVGVGFWLMESSGPAFICAGPRDFLRQMNRTSARHGNVIPYSYYSTRPNRDVLLLNYRARVKSTAH